MIDGALDVGCRRGTRANARDKAALLAQLVCRLGGVEHHGRVEVRKGDDKDDGEHPVDPAGRERVGKGLNPLDRREEHRELRRQIQNRRGEDDRHDAGGVDLDRKIGGLAAHHAPAHNALGVLDGDATLSALNEYDDRDDGNDDDERHHGKNDVARARHRGDERGGQARHDVREDDERHAVAHTVLGDDLAEPHDDHGADDHGEDHHDVEKNLGCAGVREAHAVAPEQEEVADGVEQGETDREVTRVLRDPALTGLALAGKLAKRRNHGLEQLEDNLRRDVGHDSEAEDRHAGECSAREQVEHRHGAALGQPGLIRTEQVLERGARNGQIGTEAIQQQDCRRQEQLLPEFRNAKRVGDSL